MRRKAWEPHHRPPTVRPTGVNKLLDGHPRCYAMQAAPLDCDNAFPCQRHWRSLLAGRLSMLACSHVRMQIDVVDMPIELQDVGCNQCRVAWMQHLRRASLSEAGVSWGGPKQRQTARQLTSPSKRSGAPVKRGGPPSEESGKGSHPRPGGAGLCSQGSQLRRQPRHSAVGLSRHGCNCSESAGNLGREVKIDLRETASLRVC